VVFRWNDQTPLCPAQIIDIQDFRDIRKAERLEIDSKPTNGKERMVLIRHRCILSCKDVPLPDCIRHCFLPDSLNEVADTVELEWIPASAISSPCFIFHADTIQRGLFTCRGMERFFFIRFHKTRNGKFIPLREKDWQPFYRNPLFPDTESYPEILWYNILTVKQEVKRAMSRGGQWDGRTVSAKILGVLPSLFSYLVGDLEGAIGHSDFLHSFKGSRTKKIVYDNLSVNKRRLKLKGQLIRVLYEDELAAVRKIFGTTFAVGITNTVPSKKMLRENPSMKSTVLLHNTDVVRIVTCSDIDEGIGGGIAKPSYHSSRISSQQRPTTQLCSYRGIDFRYNHLENGIPELSVQCRFVKVNANSVVLKELMNPDTSDGDSSDSGSSGIFVSKGDYLTLEGSRVYLVTEINCDGTVRCVSPANAVNVPFDITMDEAIAGLLKQCT
jgi:hypothetical protein